jgi:hypothetical protein
VSGAGRGYRSPARARPGAPGASPRRQRGPWATAGIAALLALAVVDAVILGMILGVKFAG